MPITYLDNNATTRVLPEVVEVVCRHWQESFANPGSRHAAGRHARQVLEAARESLAGILGAYPDEVLFTSGGTESNNMAVLGFTEGEPGTISLTAGEHPAVMNAARHRETHGWRLAWLPVDETGRLRFSADELPADTRLASVILAHNETGVIQDLRPLIAECNSRNISCHVDAMQAVGKIPVDFHALGATSLALGAHKFHGPRGIGALLLKRGADLAACTFGGYQEAGRRPGTEAVALIAGMAKALELFHAEQEERMERLRSFRDRLEEGLAAACPPVILNGHPDCRLPNTLNIAFPGVDGEALLVALELEGIACSLGSACASGAVEPAPVLVAMNRPREILRSSMRFSFGVDNREEELADAIRLISKTVRRLRGAAS